jgi:hypothetical protein
MTSPSELADPRPARPRSIWLLLAAGAFVAVIGVAIWLKVQFDLTSHDREIIAQLEAKQGVGNVAWEPRWTAPWLQHVARQLAFFRVAQLACYAPGNSFSYDVDAAGQLVIVRNCVRGISPAELHSIQRLTALEVLSLEANPITDEGLAGIEQMRMLQVLNLANTAVTDASADVFPQLPVLERLDLSRTDVTDAAIPSLSRCLFLKHLNVEMTRITPAGVKSLELALPGCTVEH